MRRYCDCCGIFVVKSNRYNAKYCGGENLIKRCLTCKKYYRQKCRKSDRLNSYCSINCQNSNETVIKKANDSRKILDYQAYAHEQHVKALQLKYGDGITNISQLQYIKDKKKLNGPTGFAREEFKVMIKEKYGVDNVSELDSIKQLKRDRALEMYGVENVFQSEVIKERIKKTNFERYGVECILSLPEVQEKSLESNGRRISKVNQEWRKLLEEELHISLSLEYNNGFFLSDLGCKDFCFEINPTVSHNSTINYAHAIGKCFKIDCSNHQPLASTYHMDRFIKCHNGGVTLFNYFDWMQKSLIIEHIKDYMVIKSKGVSKYVKDIVENCENYTSDWVNVGTDNKIFTIFNDKSEVVYEAYFKWIREFNNYVYSHEVGELKLFTLMLKIFKDEANDYLISLDNSFNGYRELLMNYYGYGKVFYRPPLKHEVALKGYDNVIVYDCGATVYGGVL